MNLFPDGYDKMTHVQRANWHSSQAWRYARNARRGAVLSVACFVLAAAGVVGVVLLAVSH